MCGDPSHTDSISHLRVVQSRATGRAAAISGPRNPSQDNTRYISRRTAKPELTQTCRCSKNVAGIEPGSCARLAGPQQHNLHLEPKWLRCKLLQSFDTITPYICVFLLWHNHSPLFGLAKHEPHSSTRMSLHRINLRSRCKLGCCGFAGRCS